MPELEYPFAPTPEFPLCVCVPKPPQEICFQFPFGIKICSNRRSALKYEGLDTQLLDFLKGLQPLLAILMPILIIISLVKALIDCMNAIVDSISQLSPSPMIECLERLAELFPQLFQMIPPFSYIEFVNNVCLFLITLLDALIDLIEQISLIDITARLDLLPDDDRMRCCLDANITALLDQLAAGLRVSGPIFQVLAQILGILAIPPLKPFIQPLRDFALFMDGLTNGTAIDVAVIQPMRDVQGVLRAISNVLENLGGSRIGQLLQKANDCDCDR